MFWHIFVQHRAASRIPIFVAGALWTSRLVFWLFRVFSATSAAIHTRRQEKGAVYVQVSCSRPIRTFPGCYFFLFLPSKVFTSSFPMLVMWHSSKSLEGSENEIGFLISESGRFFNHSSFKIGKSLLLDGPYGRNIDLWNYETVILAAKGMGIAGILSSALFLLDRRNLDLVAKKQTKKRLFRDRTRKVALVWALEDNFQENWAALAIHNLQKVDKEKILLFWCIYPSEQTKNPPFQLGEHWKCFYSKKGQEGKYLNWVVSQDTRSPGRHVVMACGDSNFTSTARQIVIDQSREDYPIQFVESEYRPSSYGRGGKISELKLQEQGDARAKMTKKTGFHPAIKTKKAIA
ncbi:hypothetical protein RB594_008176 [Gaeumannomyces avenae]